jgi:hypothetical protein
MAKYEIYAHLVADISVIAHLETDSWEAVEDFIWDKTQEGFDCIIYDTETGERYYTYADDFDEEALNPEDLIRKVAKKS